MLKGGLPVTLLLEQWRPGIGRRLFSDDDASPLPSWPGTVLRQLSLQRLEDCLGGLTLAELVPSCAHAVRGRQLTHLAGRLCAEAALHGLTGRYDAIGRRSDGAPCWPPGVQGSIAHDRHGAVAVVAYRHGCRWLGIDVEPVLDEAGSLAVREVCLTMGERQAVAGSPLEDATLRFSAKEAYYKAVHPVLGGPMDFLDVELASFDPDDGRFRVVPAAAPAIRAGLPALEGYFAIEAGRVFTGIAC